MGEIKSTLDIIMEKTKSLTMTKDEKEELRRKEWTNQVKGWVQKFLDGLTNLEKLKSELEKEPELQEVLGKELLERLQPDGDNIKIFQLMKGVLNIEKGPFLEVINEFQKEVACEQSKRLKNMKKQLTKRSIFGSAVIPNLTLDESWSACYQKLEADFKKRLKSVIGN